MISIFLDTNILFSRTKDFTKAQYVEKLDELISEIEVNDIYDNVKLIIPRITLHELFEQQKEKFDEFMLNCKGYKLPNIEIKNDLDYRVYLSDLFEKAEIVLGKSTVKIEIAPFPKDTKLPSIINRAIGKLPPFEGKSKVSDKGFKDVVLWETLKEYKENHISDTIVLFSNDNLLTDVLLIKEYENEFRDNLHLVKEDKNQLLQVLSRILNAQTELSFEAQLEKRLSIALNEKNETFNDMMLEEHIWGDGTVIEGFQVKSMDIIGCSNEKIDDMLEYSIELSIFLWYENITYLEDYKLEKIRQFDIFYDFISDDFYVQEYDNLVLGRCRLNNLYSITRGQGYYKDN
ncbi:MAG: PIN domain-containing protein [Lachnospiraceae bacterium]|nr:PIN domain-containing protein [Lachnospiraceae bacterium]